VGISQVFTTPSESIEKASPSLVCRLTHLTGAGARVVGSESGVFVFAEKALICQKLMDLPKDFDTRVRGEEKIRVGEKHWELGMDRRGNKLCYDFRCTNSFKFRTPTICCARCKLLTYVLFHNFVSLKTDRPDPDNSR